MDLISSKAPESESFSGKSTKKAPREPLIATMQKLAPLWDQLSSLPPQQSIDAMMEAAKPHLKTLAVLMYSLAPHFALSEIHPAINDATDEELSEARVYLRQVAAAALQVRGARVCYRRIRKALAAVSAMFRSMKFRGHAVPRWTKRFQDLLTLEGLVAFATFSLLRGRQAMKEIDQSSSTSNFSAKKSVVSNKQESRCSNAALNTQALGSGTLSTPAPA